MNNSLFVEVKREVMAPQTQSCESVVSISSDASDAPGQMKKCPCWLRCCDKFRLETDDATGFAMLMCGAGPVLMSNAFLSDSGKDRSGVRVG